MASLPPSQRPSGSQRSSPPSTSPLSSPTSSQAAEDHQEPILLNPSSSSHLHSSSSTADQTKEETSSTFRPAGVRTDSVDVRRCWICFSDETEDTPLSSSWRSPCPCALTAHESCILDWVADMEGSNNGRSKKILCPQCKSEIVIARPRSLVVDAVKGLESAAGRMVLPSIIVIGGSTAIYLSLSYGAIAVHAVLGAEDFHKIFDAAVQHPSQLLRRLVGLSIVPWMLILSRTSIADSVLPIVPMLFFVTQPRPDPIVDFTSWPPSAGLSFALLPYVRAAYNTYYEVVWGERVRKWTEKVKPRSSSTETRAENDLELEIGLEEGDETDDEENNANDQAAPPPPPVALAPEEAAAAAVPAQAQNQGIVHQHRRDYSISVSRVTQSVLGALVFPGISALMGDLLRIALPSTWTFSSGRYSRPTRFLQTRWGRSIVGGCLFVVLKDAITLYVRWRMAQNHDKRKVVDYDKSKAKKRSSTRA